MPEQEAQQDGFLPLLCAQENMMTRRLRDLVRSMVRCDLPPSLNRLLNTAALVSREVGLEMAMALELLGSTCILLGTLLIHQHPLQQVLSGSS